ncbi:disulfide bond formation protein DsbB [Shewanella psychropiezotolerans]|uniref:Disulfide bond formation protein B n=1 Tax=Shewanella psychropiezotolerans TaxID=2593655 RepID=A0ABX5WYX3_9GAMM|nr:disulfide bond formation protein DsbB [Shewanella psychropiezotolerans]QDO83407.1 disulfide bond formation protein DsbB [Shewanella psychropiezotolerans]
MRNLSFCSIFHCFKDFAHSKLAWGILAGSALWLETSALFFQHVMDMAPCLMCVYLRLATFCLLIAGLIGFYGHRNRFMRFTAVSIWGMSAFQGLSVALELLDMQTNPSPFAVCSFVPNFPAWMPLHEWLPSMFLPVGSCYEIPIYILGLSMAEWMVVAFCVYAVLCIAFFIPALSRTVEK